MCDPIFWTGVAANTATGAAATSGLFGAGGVFSIGTALGTVSSIGGAASSLMGGSQTSANYKYQAQMAGYQAQIYENNALAAQYSAEYDRQKFEDRFKREILAKQGPGYAASGVVINQDTPAQVADDAFKEGKQEELALLYRGQTAANAARQNALGYRFAAKNYRTNVGSSRTAGYIGAGTSLLSAFS
jgi:hypothetical protein